jgi:orotate phosphoribosyltransferase
MNRRDEVRQQALKKLQDFEVLMRGGHFDYGNGYHGRTYLNAHQLFRYPSTIWQLAQDLLDILPSEVTTSTEVVAGPVTGGALLAHTLAGLLDGRRALTHPPCTFAPFSPPGDRGPRTDDASSGGFSLRSFYATQIAGKRVLLADDVRNTGKTFERCAELVRAAGGSVLATVEIYDRLEAMIDLGVSNFSLASYRASENFRAAECPMCQAGEAITAF